MKSLVVATGLTVALLLSLGVWQVQRLQWKTALIAETARQMAAPAQALPAELPMPAAWDWRHVSVEGRWLADETVLLQAQVLRDRLAAQRVGVHVLTAFQRSGSGDAVLVDRGFVPMGTALEALSPLPQGAVTVTGLARVPPAQGWKPDNRPERGAWYFIDLPALAAAWQLPGLQPLYLAQDAGAPGTLPVGGQAEPVFENNHLGYAVFWFSMAPVAIFFAWRVARGRKTPA